MMLWLPKLTLGGLIPTIAVLGGLTLVPGENVPGENVPGVDEAAKPTAVASEIVAVRPQEAQKKIRPAEPQPETLPQPGAEPQPVAPPVAAPAADVPPVLQTPPVEPVTPVPPAAAEPVPANPEGMMPGTEAGASAEANVQTRRPEIEVPTMPSMQVPPGWVQREMLMRTPMIVPQHFPTPNFGTHQFPAIPMPSMPNWGNPNMTFRPMPFPPQHMLGNSIPKVSVEQADPGSLRTGERVEQDLNGRAWVVRERVWTQNGVQYQDQERVPQDQAQPDIAPQSPDAVPAAKSGSSTWGSIFGNGSGGSASVSSLGGQSAGVSVSSDSNGNVKIYKYESHQKQ